MFELDIRRVYAELYIDCTQADRYAEVNGIGESAPIPYLENRLKTIEDSGIRLGNAVIADEDEDDLRYAYRNYLVDWAMNSDVERDVSPLSFEQWK